MILSNAFVDECTIFRGYYGFAEGFAGLVLHDSDLRWTGICMRGIAEKALWWEVAIDSVRRRES